MSPDSHAREPHEHASEAGAPGASAPGEQPYEGRNEVGDEGAVAGPEAFQDPFGRPDTDADGPRAPEVPGDVPEVEKQWQEVRGADPTAGEAPTS